MTSTISGWGSPRDSAGVLRDILDGVAARRKMGDNGGKLVKIDALVPHRQSTAEISRAVANCFSPSSAIFSVLKRP